MYGFCTFLVSPIERPCTKKKISEGAMENVCIDGVSLLSGFNLEKFKGFLSPGTKQTVRNNEVSVLMELCHGSPVHFVLFCQLLGLNRYGT